jgi:hypothetical protein
VAAGDPDEVGACGSSATNPSPKLFATGTACTWPIAGVATASPKGRGIRHSR